MNTPLNVLILEDRYADAELMLEELRKAGFTPEWRCVQTERDYLAALDPSLDVILADHSLPQYDSVRALQGLLERRDLDVPFIVVSGVINEELAVSLLKRGAADYILKDRLARLGQAVVQAVEQRTLRREKQNLEQQLLLFRTLLDHTNVVIAIVDAETGQFLDVNKAACQVYGYTREEFLRLSVPDVTEAPDTWTLPGISHDQRKRGFAVIEDLHCSKDGLTFPVEVYSNFVQLDRGYTVMVVRDINERNREEAARLKAIKPSPSIQRLRE